MPALTSGEVGGKMLWREERAVRLLDEGRRAPHPVVGRDDQRRHGSIRLLMVIVSEIKVALGS